MTTLLTIAKAVDVFTYKSTKPLKIGLAPEHAVEELKILKQRTDDFAAASNAVAENASLKNDPAVVAAVKRGKISIAKSAMESSLSDKYFMQIRSFDDFETGLEPFLKSIFRTTLTDKQKLEIARKKLVDATRFSKESESFKVFKSRLDIIAKPILDIAKKDAADLLVSDAFRKNLPPNLRQFLIDHGEDDKTVDEIAAFLDGKQKHVYAQSVNNLEASRIDDLTMQITALTELVKTALISPKDIESCVDAEINKIGVKKPVSSQKKDMQNKRPDWMYRDNGRPIRCQQCGLFGHHASKCPRDCSAVCHKCGRRGHLQAVCRSAKNAN